MTDIREYTKWEDIDGNGNYKRKSAYCDECGVTCGVDNKGCCEYCGREICGE